MTHCRPSGAGTSLWETDSELIARAALVCLAAGQAWTGKGTKMTFIHRIHCASLAVATCAVLAIGVLCAPLLPGAVTPAMAQISEDAQIALEQYGGWRPHPRFGEVWVPGAVPPDWRPYEYGHWVYTDEWGWYWVSDDVEAGWGWVVYHYGRWAFELGIGWFWVPGDEWAPAWVNWRYGDDFVGWAPLPPDELIESYEIQPAYWVFVPGRYMAAPRLRPYIVPVYRRTVLLRETRVVNRTVPVHGVRLAVNPGISPAFVARVSGAPVATYRVRPRVFASTQGVSGAVQVRREELRGGPGGPRGPGGPAFRPGSGGPRPGAISVERTTTLIQPSAAATPPQPLNKNEPGRLGTHPPRAAQETVPSTAPAQTPPPQPPQAPTPPANQRQAPTVQQQAPPGATPPPGSTPPATTTAPGNVAPSRREEHRERVAPGSPPGGSPAQQPNIVRPTPPQVPPSPPPQQRQVQPPPPPTVPPPQQRQVQPPPQPAPPPPQQQQRQVQPPPGAHPPPPPAGARPPAPPQKKPPPQPGEKQDEKK